MSNLLKSKFLLGVLIVVAVFAVVGVALPSTAAADCSITTTLREGSVGVEVQCLQGIVGATADGKFGPLTKASVMAWQAGHGLVADGVVGPLTRAALAGAGVSVGSFPAGCTSSSGFSTSTGLSCSGSSTLPSGCSSTAGYSPTTGAKCDGGSTATPVAFEGTEEGKLSSFEEDAADTSDVDEGTTEQEILNVSFEAETSDQKVTRVDVDFQAADSTESSKPWDYFKKVSLTLDGDVIATKTVTSSDDWDRTDEASVTYDTYTVRFSNLDFIVKDGSEAQLAVAVDVIDNVDGSDEGQSWEAAIPVNGIRAISPNGLTETYPTTELNVDFTVAGSDTGTLSWSQDSDNPSAMAITLDDAVDTNNVLLAVYNLEADNQDIFVEDILIETTITTTGTMDQTSDLVQTFRAKVYDADGDLVITSTAAGNATADLTNIDHTFSNLDFTIPNGDTYEVKFYADFQPLDGTIVKDTDTIVLTMDASDTVAEQASGGNDGDAVTATGDITGKTHAVFASAPLITHVSSTITKTLACDGVCAAGEAERAEATITFTVKAVEADVYVPDEFVEDTDETDTTYGSGSTYFLDEHAGTEPTPVALASSDASTSTNGWIVYKGEEKTFTYKVTITALADGYQSVGMSSIEWGLTNVAGGNAANEDYTYSLQPDWETPSIYLEFTAA
ncbi:MAG: Cell wall-associated hydrolase, invasion-associated protein [Candidatus Nomurabacteria bacterium GW2011_GWF1_42_40]|nr:MAG: Cell wall-associated hydrolase, invasion-associated protein [Candidatus Nomurabacteria bacterium GW2011_GWF1_42_40]